MKYIEDASPIIRELLSSGKIRIVGGVYNLETRKVEFIEPTQSARIVLMPRRKVS